MNWFTEFKQDRHLFNTTLLIPQSYNAPQKGLCNFKNTKLILMESGEKQTKLYINIQ